MTTLVWTNAAQIMQTLPLEGLVQYLPRTDQQRTWRYRQMLDRYQFVLGRLLLGYGLCQMRQDIQALHELQYGERGKPHLPGLAFNISHSRGIVACAWSAPQALGLDVEVPRTMKRAHFRHCFTGQEWHHLEQDETSATFYHYWTAKEAVLKAQGWGLDRLMDVQIEAAGQVSILGEISDLTWQSFTLGGAPACLCQSSPEVPQVLELSGAALLDGLP